MSDTFRYIPQMIIPEIGAEGQQKITAAKILVVGAGGLGCPVLQYLTGMGVGLIGIIDDDTVSKSNLHRQILYTEDEVGKLKAIAAKERLSKLNSDIVINAFTERLHADNAEAIILLYDIVMDCSDNIETRYIIDEVTRRLNKPLIWWREEV